MEITGASFLFTSATLMITFAGFSILFLAVRQTTGKRLSSVDIFLTRNLVALLFTMAAGALVPSLLGFYRTPEVWIRKISALAFGLPMLAQLLTYRRRRIAQTGKPPTLVGHVVLIGLGSVSVVAMIIYMFGNFEYIAGAYITALIANFFILAFTFVQAIGIILHEPTNDA